MKENVLIIDMCKDNLHSLEFVKPIKYILEEENKKYFIKKYNKITKKDIGNCSRIIISGTSLIDFGYLEFKKRFNFLKEIKKPILGICAGAQIIASVFEGKVIKKKEIGLKRINFNKNFLGLLEIVDVYELHNFSIIQIKNFDIFSQTKKSIQAFKHKNKKIYGAIFHPEVRNKKLIVNFLRLK